MSTPNIDDVATTVAEYENLAISTGARVRIDPPEFSDGLSVTPFTPFWLVDENPKVARVTVYRDDVPTTVYVSWAESLPAEDSWRALWQAKPMKLFGAYVVRAALRRAFRDAIGDRREPDEQTTTPAPAAERDWDAEIRGAQTPDAVNALHAEMKQHRAMTVIREIALREQLQKTTDAAWQPAPVEERTATGALRTAERRPGAPRDYLPPAGNRAARRKAARRKGGKR